MPVLCDEIRRLGDGLDRAELERARAQLKAGLLMSLESTAARCEQQAAHMLVFGRPLDLPSMVRADRWRSTRVAVARRGARGCAPRPPTLDRARSDRRALERYSTGSPARLGA